MNEATLFAAALEKQDVAERAAFLDEACGGDQSLRKNVEELLQAHERAGGFLAKPAVAEATAAFRGTPEAPEPVQATTEGIGTHIGAYKLLQKLGEGGMGSVYLAEQSVPVQRRVALKIIRTGMDSAHVVARFEQERQALAMMDHPNIAKVLDAGTTEAGLPYFVMELVKGVPLTKFCDQEHLTPRERLQLFIPVCEAVQHAHQKGIIHRDLKPSNVLVALYDGRPIPKVIDFGVAKATQRNLTERTMFTEVGQIVGTLEYMAPEQAELNNLDIDTRADVYSLGVILYELLAGVPPFSIRELRNAAYTEMLRLIKEVEPPKPSTRLSGSAELANIAAKRKLEPKRLRQVVHGDLDWIVMKCLEKERGRRYETANGLGLDLRRYLADEPVLAGPPSVRYRVHKFVRRNRGAVIAVGLVALALIGGIVGTTWGLLWAEHQRGLAVDAADEERQAKIREAEQHREAVFERDKARAAEKLAGDRLLQVEAEQKRTLAQKLIAEAVRNFLQVKLLGQADARLQADELVRGGGLASEADRNITIRELLDRAAAEVSPDRIEANFPKQPFVQAEILMNLGNTYRAIGELAPAIAFLQRAVALQQVHSGPEHEATTITQNYLALAYYDADKLPEAIQLHQQVRKVREKTLGSDHALTQLTLVNLAASLSGAGRGPEAMQILEQVKGAQERKLPPQHSDMQLTLVWLARTYHLAGKLPQAITLFERVRHVQETALGIDHPNTLLTLHELAAAYRAAGKVSDAIRLFEHVRDLQEKKLGPDHPKTLQTLTSLAGAYRASGKLTDAINIYEQILKVSTQKLGTDHIYTMSVLNGLGLAYRDAGRLPEAIKHYEQARTLHEKKLGSDHPSTLAVLNNLAVAHQDVGKLQDAIKLLEQVRDGREKKLGVDHPDTLSTLNNLAVAYRDARRFAEAIKLLEQVRRAQEEQLGPEHPSTLITLINLASTYRRADRLAEAVALFEQASDTAVKKLGPVHPNTLTAQAGLASAYQSLGRLPEAIKLYDQVRAGQVKKLGPDHPTAIVTLNNLAGAYRDSGDLERGIQLFEQAAEGIARGGFRHGHAAGIINNLSECCELAKQFERGETWRRKVLALLKEREGASSEAYAGQLAFLGLNLLTQQKWADAEVVLRECRALREKQEPDGWGTFHAKSMLGGALLGRKQFAEAEPLLLAGYEGLKRNEKSIPPQGKSILPGAIRRLVELYDGLGTKDKADEWRKVLEAATKPAE